MSESFIHRLFSASTAEAHQNIIRLLYEGVLYTHETLETAAQKMIFLNDLNATLIFALVKNSALDMFC
jgi:hypothetical protein